MSSMINRAAVKRAALDFATAHRGGKFTRVSASFLDDIEDHVRTYIRAMVRAHPSVGKTLMGTKRGKDDGDL